MLRISLGENPKTLDIKFKYNIDYIRRIKQTGATFIRPRKAWSLPVSKLGLLEQSFSGELVYLTPRHIILQEPPPPPPDWYKDIPIESLDNYLKLPLYPYQTFGANFLLYRLEKDGYALLCDDVGLGKTPQAVAAAKILKEQGKINKVLVVCLSGAKMQWAVDGVEKFTDMTCEVIMTKTKQQRIRLYESAMTKDVVIINYQLLLTDMALINALKCDMIIFDEIHKIPNHTAKMNRASAALQAKYKIALTGTPLMNKPEDIYGIFDVLKLGCLGKITQFRHQYMNLSFNGYVMELVGCKNLDELRERIKAFWIRRTAEDVGIQIPENMPPIYHYVEPSKLQIELFNELRLEMQTIQDELKKNSKKISWERTEEEERQFHSLNNRFRSILNLMIAASDTLELFGMSKSEHIKEKYETRYTNIKTSPKLDMCKELVEEITNNGNKVIIFTQFERMTRILHREMQQYGKCVVYHGGMEDDAKTEARNMFQDESDSGAMIFIATDAASNSLNLQASRYIINYDLPWNPATVTQRTGRIRRVNSKFSSVFTINIITMGTIDEIIMEALQSKRDLFQVLVENTHEEQSLIKKLTQKLVIQ